jgi:hypothetical protein
MSKWMFHLNPVKDGVIAKYTLYEYVKWNSVKDTIGWGPCDDCGHIVCPKNCYCGCEN